MEFLITESQLKLILQEQDQSKMSDYMKEMYSFTKNLVEKVKKIYGLNLRLLLTWGASVGGFVLPLSEFIKTGRFNLTEEQQIEQFFQLKKVLIHQDLFWLKKLFPTYFPAAICSARRRAV